MPKTFLISLMILGISASFAQSTKVYPNFYEVFTCKNSNGVTETLLTTFNKDGKKGFIYKSSKNPNKEIPLTIVSNENDEVYVINFPNEKKNYTLKTCMDCPEIQCTNPDGSKQIFNLNYNTWGNRGTYRCINADNSVEYLRIEGSASRLIVKYSSSKRTQWITLEVSNVNASYMDSLHFFDVRFPNDKKSYRVESSGEKHEYYVSSPNGLKQAFLWINK